MARQRFPASTWLLLGLAVLSMGGAIAVWLGSGSKAHSLWDDPSPVAALPKNQLRTVTARLGPAGQYKIIGERPLFSADRRPAPAVAVAVEAAAELDFTLYGVIITDRLSMAILRDRGDKTTRARLNERIEAAPEWRLVELMQKQAVFEGPTGKRTLDLRVFDGSGGEAPTSVRHSSPVAASNVVERTAPRAPERVIERRKVEAANSSQNVNENVKRTATSIQERIQAQRKKLRQKAASQ